MSIVPAAARANLTLTFVLLFFSCQHSVNAPRETPNVGKLIQDNFATPDVCGTCHPAHYQEWQQSMHAFAIADPIFQKLSTIAQDRSKGELNQFCVKCHTPLGSQMGETDPGFNFNNLSPLANAAISCEVCHTLKQTRRGEGVTSFFFDGVKRGSIPEPAENAFHKSAFDGRYKVSHFCSSCHQVASPDKSFDLETTSLEWDQSGYLVATIDCQLCHMPTYSGQAATGAPVRDELHRHTFVGVDYRLIDFPGKEETIRQVRDLLQNAAELTVDAPQQVQPSSEFRATVTIANRYTGHNLPSGTIFERQMWLEVTLKDGMTGVTYFSTGLLDDNGDLRNHHSEYVASGAIPSDTSLVLFNGTAIDKNGNETLFFWEAGSIKNKTIPPHKSSISEFILTAPASAQKLELSTRLRFRSFPPYVFRAIGGEAFIQELRIFDMERYTQKIAVVP